jgi:hypothetical protein
LRIEFGLSQCGNSAFRGCAIEKIQIPELVAEIGDRRGFTKIEHPKLTVYNPSIQSSSVNSSESTSESEQSNGFPCE